MLLHWTWSIDLFLEMRYLASLREYQNVCIRLDRSLVFNLSGSRFRCLLYCLISTGSILYFASGVFVSLGLLGVFAS